MAARAAELGDIGESAPGTLGAPARARRRPPGDLTRSRPDDARLEAVLAGARDALRRAARASRAIWRQDCLRAADRADLVRVQGRHQPPGHRGQRHPRHQPARGAVQGRRVRPRLPQRDRRAAPDARSPRCSAATAATSSSASSTPAWRPSASTCAPRPASREDEELLAAKFVGRWPSGAPLALAPERDDPELGADPARNNAFLYVADDDARRAQVPARGRTPGGRTRATRPSSAWRGCTGSSGAAPATARCCPRASWKTTAPIAASCSSASRRTWPASSSSSRPSGSTTAPSSARPDEKDPLVGPNDGTEPLHRPPAADPPAPDRAAPVRGQPRRRVLLHARPARARWIAELDT